MKVEFRTDVEAMVLHGPRNESQFISDFLAGFALSDQSQDTSLCRGRFSSL
jgi:hypothetical protein